MSNTDPIVIHKALLSSQNTHDIDESSINSGNYKITPESSKPVVGSTYWQATINICKCGLGSTLLFMPSAFATAGWVEVIGILTLTGIMCNYSWGLMIKVLESVNEETPGVNHTLQMACGKVLGKNYQYISDTITVMFNVGSILGYMIFILKSLNAVTNGFLDDPYQPYVVLVALSVVYFPFSMLRNIEKLSLISSFGVFSCCVAFLTVIIDSIYILISSGVSQNGDVYTNYFTFKEISSYFGVIMFAYDINGVVTEVHTSMQDKSKFPEIIRNYVIFMFSVGVILGALAYLALGMQLSIDTNEIIFKELNNLGGYIYVLNLIYALALLGSLLLYAFPLFRRFDKHLNAKIEEHTNKSIIVRCTVRMIFYYIVMMAAILYPNILQVMNLLGSVFSVSLGFIFPIAIYHKRFKGSIEIKTYIMDYTVLVLGIVGGISGVYSTIVSF